MGRLCSRLLGRIFAAAALLALAAPVCAAKSEAVARIGAAQMGPEHSVAASPPARASAPAWAVDPAVPGPDLPPEGRSLFDLLFAQGRTYDVPYPFTALMRRLAQHAGVDALGRPGLKRVLIPLGRSLQRTAPAPQFFRFPRVVTAVDGESASAAALLLKDRLYIGYQEKSAVLEVISYNERGGRFEFQVVKDYRAGATPRVFYANRAVCTTCHQNHAPIFSRQQWDETNANPELAARMREHGGRYFGIPVARGVDEPYAIDNATDRANLFPAWQRLWRDGCGPGDRGDRCRAAAFVLMLQYRLTSRSQFDRDGATYREAYRGTLEANWRKLWPQGLAIADPNLPNRSPATVGADAALAMHVPAAFEPLLPRPALETWDASRPEDIDRLVAGLADFVPQRDAQRIDRTLLGRGEHRPIRQLTAACDLVQRKALGGNRSRISLRCGGKGEALALRGRLYAQGASVTGGAVEGLSVENSGPLATLTIAGGTLSPDGAAFTVAGQGMSARTHRGDHIERMELRWSKQSAQIRVRVRDDFILVEAAVMQLARAQVPGFPSPFGAQAFQRAALVDALDAALRGGSRPCCRDRRIMAAARIEQLPREQGTAHDGATSTTDLTRFYRACARCHDTAETFPPNFLAGDAKRAEANFRHCAQRIFVRLRMWRAAAPQRIKTPMPPPLGLSLLDTTPAEWLAGAELDALLQEVEAVLTAETGSPPTLEGYERAGYENLRGCLVGAAAPRRRRPALPHPRPLRRTGKQQLVFANRTTTPAWQRESIGR
jgi:hypothetical protein